MSWERLSLLTNITTSPTLIVTAAGLTAPFAPMVTVAPTGPVPEDGLVGEVLLPLQLGNTQSAATATPQTHGRDFPIVVNVEYNSFLQVATGRAQRQYARTSPAGAISNLSSVGLDRKAVSV